MTRRLSLRREHLAELAPAELAAVAGGDPVTLLRTGKCPTAPFFSGIYPSINVDCTSVMDETVVC